MKKQQRRPTHPSAAHLQESVATLRDAAKDLVLDAARLWREQKGNAWTQCVLASSLDILVRSETVLGEGKSGWEGRASTTAISSRRSAV